MEEGVGISEFLNQMGALDLIMILLWIGCMVFGYFTGIFRQMFVSGGILVGAVLASAIAPALSFWTGVVSGFGTAAAFPATYSFLMLVIAALFWILTSRTYPSTGLVGHQGIDRAGGTFIGFVTGLIAVTQLTAMLMLLTDGSWPIMDGSRAALRQQLETTPFLPLVISAYPHITALIQALIPRRPT